MALAIDTTRAARSRAALLALVRAVRDAPPTEQETNWLEWKSRLDLSKKPAHAVIAKAVLGFANREPERAARAMGGTAHLLVGVQPGKLAGVDAVDIASLEPQVQVYAGDGPQWSADYVEVDGASVLVFTVEAPAWGDPIHPVRKAFLPDDKGQTLALGAIYVRQAAATDAAGPGDIDMLTRRAQGKPQADDRLILDIAQADGPGPGRIELTSDAVSDYVEGERDRLLAPMRQRNPLSAAARAFDLTGGEYRRPEAYQASVDKYLAKLARVLPAVLMARSVLHGVGALRLRVSNPTDQPFNKVEVRLRILDPEITAITDESEAERAEVQLPDPPKVWGTERELGFRYAGIRMPSIPLVNMWTPDVIKHVDATELVFSPKDVRPHSSTTLSTVWLLLTSTDPAELAASWTATSVNAKGQASGSLRLRLDGSQWSAQELLAADPADDE